LEGGWRGGRARRFLKEKDVNVKKKREGVTWEEHREEGAMKG